MLGSVGEKSVISHRAMSAVAMESGSVADTFSTPWMLALMEGAAVAAIEPYLPSQETTVGVEAHIHHEAATQIGREVRAAAKVIKTKDRTITLEVEAWADQRRIGHGTHVRRIVDRQRFHQGLLSAARTQK